MMVSAMAVPWLSGCGDLGVTGDVDGGLEELAEVRVKRLDGSVDEADDELAVAVLVMGFNLRSGEEPCDKSSEGGGSTG